MKRNDENNKKNIFNSRIISLLFSLVIVIVIFTNVLFALTNDRMLYIDNSGKLATSQITSDELLQLKNEVELLKQQQNNMKTQLDSLYPVGSIYISINSTDPATFLGGVWEQIEDGYYLRASNNNGGTLLEESLPNIKGSHPLHNQGAISTSKSPLYSTVGIGSTYTVDSANAGATQDKINFDASRANSTYKDNAPVQPKSIKVYMWKRIN